MVAHATHVASSNQEVFVNGRNKWTGVVNVDLSIRDPTRQPAITYSAPGSAGTLYALATSPSTPGPPPDTPLFGSTSQRHDHRFRKVMIDDHGDAVVVEAEMKRGSGEILALSQDEPVSFRIPISTEQTRASWQRKNNQEPTDERSGRHPSLDRTPQWRKSKNELSDSEKSTHSEKSGSLDRRVLNRNSSGKETPRHKSRSEQSDDGEDDGGKPRLPYKETSLGAIITTVETYKQNFDENESALSENIVDQIEKAFASPQIVETPRKVAHNENEGEFKRTSSMRRSKSDSSSIKDGNDSSVKLSMSEDSLNRRSSTDDRNGSSKEDLVKDKDLRAGVTSSADNKKDLSTTVAVGETPEGLTISVRARDPENNAVGINEINRDVITPQVMAVTEASGKSKDVDPRIAARNILIERIESNRHAMEGSGIEGIRIYHAKSRSQPVVARHFEISDHLEKNKATRHFTSQEDLTARRLTPHLKDAEQKYNSSRKKRTDIGRSRSPSGGHSSKPVVRSERKIKLTQSHATYSSNGSGSGSQTVPRYKPSRRNRHATKQQTANTDSDEEVFNKPRERSKDRNKEREAGTSGAAVPGRLTFSPDKTKKSASLPRDLGSASRHHESRSHHRGSTSHTKGARITKIKLGSNVDPSESIVDQTTKLLSAAANKDANYDMGTSLVIAEDVLNSLTRTSALLKSQVSSKDEKEKERKDKHSQRIKSPGKCLSCNSSGITYRK